MKIKDIFARVSGGAVGAALAVTVPHIGCLAALTPVFVGVGASATIAASATYVAGALILGGGAIAAWYGLKPSREACCMLWGETRKVRLIKGAAVAACAFAVVAAINSQSNPLSIEERARFLEKRRDAGQPIWDAQRTLESLCISRPQ